MFLSVGSVSINTKNQSIKNLLYCNSWLILQSLVKEYQASQKMFQVQTSQFFTCSFDPNFNSCQKLRLKYVFIINSLIFYVIWYKKVVCKGDESRDLTFNKFIIQCGICIYIFEMTSSHLGTCEFGDHMKAWDERLGTISLQVKVGALGVEEIVENNKEKKNNLSLRQLLKIFR